MNDLTPDEERRILANRRLRKAMARLAAMGTITTSVEADGSPVITIKLHDKKREP